MMALLEVENLCVRYGRAQALSDVSLNAPEGSIVTVIGPNGAGKSTLLNAIAGVVRSSGTVRYDGRPTAGLETEDLAARALSLVPERRDLFGSMSVIDNLRLGAFLHRERGSASLKASLEEVFALFPKLSERREQSAETLSGGERQMLAIARALMNKPRLLLLDEPSLGLAPRIVSDLFVIIAGLRASGVTILLVEQNAQQALQIADYGYVLETGSIVTEGPSAALAADSRTSDVYLGAARGAYEEADVEL